MISTHGANRNAPFDRSIRDVVESPSRRGARVRTNERREEGPFGPLLPREKPEESAVECSPEPGVSHLIGIAGDSSGIEGSSIALAVAGALAEPLLEVVEPFAAGGV